MAFPTIAVTPGSGQTINTLPNAGQATMANSVPTVIASDQSAVPVTSLNSAAITNPTNTIVRPATGGTAVSVTYATPTFTGATLQTGTPVVLSGTVPSAFNSGNVYYVVSPSSNTFRLASTFGGTALTGGTGSGLTVQITYVPGSIIASSLTTPGAHSFAIATTAGGAILPRFVVSTNFSGTLQNTGFYSGQGVGWDGVTLSVNFWRAAPTYATNQGDLQPYAPATGAVNFLGNCLVVLTQFGDGAAGTGSITAASQMAVDLVSGTSIFWDLQINTQAFPASGQTFTITADTLN